MPVNPFHVIRQTIQQYGFQIQGVFGASPEYAYTIGLTEMGWPELYLSGLPREYLRDVPNKLVMDLKGKRPRLGEEFTLAPGFKVVLQNIPSPAIRQVANLAFEYYDNKPLEFAQILYHDDNGLYPWEPGCDPKVVRMQSQIVQWSQPLGKRSDLH